MGIERGRLRGGFATAEFFDKLKKAITSGLDIPDIDIDDGRGQFSMIGPCSVHGWGSVEIHAKCIHDRDGGVEGDSGGEFNRHLVLVFVDCVDGISENVANHVGLLVRWLF